MQETLGERIRTVRKNKGLSQKALGELCGIAEANIRKYELGKQNPKYGTIMKIADALEIHYEYLIFGDKNPYKEFALEDAVWTIKENWEEVVNESDYSKETQETVIQLLLKFSDLNQAGRAKVFERIDELLELPKYTKKTMTEPPKRQQ